MEPELPTTEALEARVDKLEGMVRAAHGLRRRSDRKAARANTVNAELRETLRKKDIENRMLRLKVDEDSDMLRERLRIAEERLALVRDITRPGSDTTLIKYTGDGPVKVKAQI